MKKTHWLRTTLITLVACGLAGLLLAVILFNANPERTGVTSSIEFSFEGAAEGLAPNGIRFDMSALTSDEVLNAALEDAGLAGRYTAEQIRGNILVSGVYPKDIVKQMTGYESVLTGNAGKVASADYHATLYNVALYNDFDKNISRKDLESLLAAVMSEFRARFEQTYAVFLSEDSRIGSLAGYDYPQQLELLDGIATRYEEYALQMAEEHPDFLLNGQGFADIAARYTTLRTMDLERLSGQVTMNALSVDQDRIASQYENRIRLLEISLQELEKEAKDAEQLIAKYKRDDVIFVSTSDSLQQISGNSDTYDSLVASRKSIEDEIAQKNKELADTRLKLADIRGGEAETAESGEGETDDGTAMAPIVVSQEQRDAQKAAVEKGIASAVQKLNTYTADFAAALQSYSEREMNDSTLAVADVVYKAPKLISGSFIVLAVKTAGPICALGFMACLVGLILSRVKEEKKKA